MCQMIAKDENLIIYGQASDYDRVKSIVKIYDQAYVAKVTDEGDTLFMTADTLFLLTCGPRSEKIARLP
jgi:hypothetical protein